MTKNNEQSEWVAAVRAILERDYPEHAADATAIVEGWAAKRQDYPFGDLDYGYAAMNAAEEAEWRKDGTTGRFAWMGDNR